MQSQPSLRGSHKVCLQLPDAGRVIMQQPKPCKSPSILTNGRGTLGDMLHGTCQICGSLEAFAGQSPHAGFWPFQLGLEWCGVHHNISEWAGLARGSYVASPVPLPGCCTAPQLLHARRRLWLGECFPCCTGACHVVLRFCDDFECGRF